MTRIVQAVFIAGILLVESACTAINTGVGGYLGLDTDLKLSFTADADINPDDNKKPSPLYIRLYELKSTKMFNKADFISLYERDSEIIGADLIGVQKLKPLKPGDKRDDFLVLDDKTAYVALYAEFLQYKDAIYRVVIPIAANNVVSSSAKIRISSNTLKIIDGNSADERFDERSPDNTRSASKSTKPAAKKDTKPVYKGDEI